MRQYVLYKIISTVFGGFVTYCMMILIHDCLYDTIKDESNKNYFLSFSE